MRIRIPEISMKGLTTITLCMAAAALIQCNTVTVQTGYDPRNPRREDDNYFDQAKTRDAALKTEPAIAKVENKPEEAIKRNAPGYDDKEEQSYFNDKPQDDKKDQTSSVTPAAIDPNAEETGTASWYGRDFDGKPTASGDIFDSRKLTAAHKTMPLGTVILVKNTENNKEVLVTVNDRGPFVRGRILDLSEYGAEVLGYKEKGLTTVSFRIVRQGSMTEKGPGVTALAFSEPQAAQGGAEGNKTDAPVRQKVQAPANLPDEKSLSKYSVQVGIYSDYDNADKMGKYLSSYGAPVHIFARGSSFVVKVGEFTDRMPAEQLKTKLSADGYTAFISNP